MSNQQDKPLLVMFAGPNGSGKSSVTPLFQSQPGFPQNYINPDEIALTLEGDIMSNAYQASAIAARQRHEFIFQGQSFAFETVMSHPSKLAILETAKQAGFETQVVFVSTGSSLQNVDRVRQRVADGGHDVPEKKIISRYNRSMSLLPRAVEIADKTYIVDNSSSSPQIGAVLSQGQVIEKSETEIQWIEKTIATLDERRQETLAIEQSNSDYLLAHFNEEQYTGKIKSVGEHFLVQQLENGSAVIHENSILSLEKSAIGHDVLISYRDGVHKIAVPEISRDISETISIEDTLFNLASSAKYVVLNRGSEKTSSEGKVYSFPSGINIEKDSEGLSISYENKSIEFDRDYNVVQNNFLDKEVLQLNEQVSSIKQQLIQQNREIELERDNGLSL